MYEQLLVGFFSGGFFDAGFIDLSSVENMDDCEDKEILLNIFKYGLACTDEELLDEFEDSEFTDFDSFLKFLADKFKRKDLKFFTNENFYLASVLDKDRDLYINNSESIIKIFKSIFKESHAPNEDEDIIKFEKYKKYDKKKVLKVGYLREY